MGSFRSRVLLFALLPGSSPLFCADSALLFNKTFGGSGNDYVNAIATDPSGHVIVGGATSSYDFPVTDGSRNTATQLAGTGDSGGTWQPLGNLPAGTAVSLAVDSGATPAWYAAGSGGIFKSTDGGATWKASLPFDASLCDFYTPNCGAKSLVVHPTQPGTVYATVNGQIVKTIDGGATWGAYARPVAGPGGADYLVLDPFHPDHIFIAFAGLNFRSFDGGQSWTQFTTPAPSGGTCSNGLTPLAFDQITPNVAYLADHCNFFRSTDGGVSWSFVSAPFNSAFAAVAAPKSGAVYVPAAAGLYGSGDQGVTWTLLLAGGFGARFIAIDPAQPSVIIIGRLRSVDGGVSWSPLALGRDASAMVFDPAHSGRAIAATAGASTAFLAKLDSAGTILAATYLGGQGGASVSGVAAGADGKIYVTGSTLSRDFPVTSGAWLTAPPASGTNYFAASFDPGLKPIYGTYLPAGIAQVAGIAADSNGSAVVAGISSGSLGNSTNSTKCFVTKLKPDGSGTLFDTRFGSSNGDFCGSVAADAFGNSIVVGNTFSGDFPLTGNGTQTHKQNDRDAIVAKLDPDGNLVYSGYLGGSDHDAATAVAADGAGNIYIAGNTASKDFPITSGAYQTSLSSKCPYPSSSVNTGLIGTITYNYTDDVFLTKLDPVGNLIYSTYLGGGCYDVPRGMAVDPQGNVWITGTTDSDPFPQVMAFESGPRYTYYKAFVSEIDAGGGLLKLSSYLSAGEQPSIAVDTFGNAYIGGSTTTPQSPYSGLPALPPIVTGVHGSLAKVQPQFAGLVAIHSVGNALSLRSGPVSAGQVTAILADGLAPSNAQDLTFTPQASLPRTLLGTQVLFDGEPAALVSVAPGRVLAIAPYSLAGKRQTSVQVVFQGTLSAPMIAEVVADPAYLSLDGSGTGQAYAHNTDGTLNGVDNPAPRGSLVTVYATGIGKVDAACPEGGVAGAATEPVGGGFLSVPSVICGVFQATVKAPDFSGGIMPLQSTPLTYAVK